MINDLPEGQTQHAQEPSETPRTDALKKGIGARAALRGFNMPEDLLGALDLAADLERELLASQAYIVQMREIIGKYLDDDDGCNACIKARAAYNAPHDRSALDAALANARSEERDLIINKVNEYTAWPQTSLIVEAIRNLGKE